VSTALARTDALPEDWARLHPLSPVIRAGRGLVGVAAVVAFNSRGKHEPPWVDLAIVGVVTLAGLISWLVTRWRIHGGDPDQPAPGPDHW
jgi:hypothetical protein